MLLDQGPLAARQGYHLDSGYRRSRPRTWTSSRAQARRGARPGSRTTPGGRSGDRDALAEL